ncbi:transcriptional regulator, MerR family [Pseudonocardia sp. N23]|nr:transcriptional regulator, MerR family [Pseudonocardia sp. N23]
MATPDIRGDKSDVVASWEPIVGAIGPKVREVRQLLGLSLQQLAGRSEVSAAAIHKVERGDMVPTITTLLKLSSALGRPIGFFVDDADWAGPVGVHIRGTDRPPAPLDWAPEVAGVNASAIAVPNERLRGSGVWAEIEPGGASGDGRSVRSGEELVLVVSGVLAVDIAGERYRLEAGDSLHFPADRPHSWQNPGPDAVTAVWWLLRS